MWKVVCRQPGGTESDYVALLSEKRAKAIAAKLNKKAERKERKRDR
jgi:hypothetical protein